MSNYTNKRPRQADDQHKVEPDEEPTNNLPKNVLHFMHIMKATALTGTPPRKKKKAY